MWRFSDLCLLLVVPSVVAVPWPIGDCVAPATCTPPAAKYSLVKPVPSRQQWLNSGGYCGALSVSAIAQSYGIWVSQDMVRKAVDNGTSPHGQMIMHYNIQKALDALKLTHVDWDWQNTTTPQSEKYMSWLKQQLSAGNPVVWMITTKELGESRTQENDNGFPALPIYTHIEPVWGVYSNRSLDDSTVYSDDVLVHGADYGANRTVEAPSLYRRFDSLVDSPLMLGNCSKATAGIGHNEYYPCIMKSTGIGYAMTGIVEPASARSFPLALQVDSFDEPDFPYTSDTPIQLHGTLTIRGLQQGQEYTLLRWDDYHRVPTDGKYLDSKYDYKYTFTASGSTHVYKDENTFINSGSTYYRCIKADAAVAVHV